MKVLHESMAESGHVQGKTVSLTKEQQLQG